MESQKEIDQCFVPSEDLTRKILVAQQAVSVKETLRPVGLEEWVTYLWVKAFIFFRHGRLAKPINFTSRLDITPTEMPSSPDEPLSVRRGQEAIRIRFIRILGVVSQQNVVDYSAFASSVFRVASYGDLEPEMASCIADDFGFPLVSTCRSWSKDFVKELVEWLRTKPDHKQEYRWATLQLTDDERIELYCKKIEKTAF